MRTFPGQHDSTTATPPILMLLCGQSRCVKSVGIHLQSTHAHDRINAALNRILTYAARLNPTRL